MRRKYQQCLAEAFLLKHIVELLVVHLVAMSHCLNHLRILAHEELEQRHERCLRLAIVARLGEHDDVLLVALLLPVAQRNGIGHTAIEHGVAIERHRL